MKKPIINLDKFREQFVRWTLRKASFRWPPRGEAMKAARVGRGLYLCAICKQTFKNKEVKLDHIEPVVPLCSMRAGVEGDVIDPTFNVHSFVLRLFCEAGGFQVLCTSCHDVKTKGENDVRRESKRRAKE